LMVADGKKKTNMNELKNRHE